MDIYNASYQNYGAPKITAELHKKGETISERTVGKYMQQIGIKAQWVKPYTRTTVNPDFSSSLKNILNEQFNPEHPNAVWCSDITYIWTEDGFAYLTSIMDLYSRKIIAWTLLLHQLNREDLCEETQPKAYEDNRRNMQIFQGFLTTDFGCGASRKFRS